MTPPPVDPWSASATGSVYRDAPGMLRENGWAQPYTVCAGPISVDGYTGSRRAICSGTGSTYLPLNGGESQSVLPILQAGQSLSIFSIQTTAGCGAAPAVVSLHVSGNGSTLDVDTRKATTTGHKDGPFFMSFSLPIRVNGPAKVWINVDSEGSASKAFSRFIINYIRVDEEDTIIS
tara:strand:+ start:148 stop:678 length:531 start_codon:yes stop_codon:yes gene_type:complete